MKQYQELLHDILATGVDKDERTGTGARSVFGRQMRFDLNKGFPLLTTKKVHLKSIIYELLWMMQGRTDVKWLQDRGVRIWDEWQNADGSIGPGYGAQWRSWAYEDYACGKTRHIDQLGGALEKLKNNPNCRRNIVSAWNVADIDDMALPACHMMFQFYVDNGRLSCHMYQRSCDFFLGVPFNIASYALLTHMMARMAGLKVREFIWTGGDTHLYMNHFAQAKEQLSREPKVMPTMLLADRGQGLDDWEYEDFKLINYDPHPGIKADVSV